MDSQDCYNIKNKTDYSIIGKTLKYRINKEIKKKNIVFS